MIHHSVKMIFEQSSIITRHGRVTSTFPVWRCVIAIPVKQPYYVLPLLSVIVSTQAKARGRVGWGLDG